MAALFDSPQLRQRAAVAFAVANLLVVVWFMTRSSLFGGSANAPAPLRSQAKPWLPGPSAPPSTRLSCDKIAVIVETRMLDNLVPLMMHFSMVLGSSWQVVLFTMEKNWEMPASAPFRSALEDKRIRVEYLPPETDLTVWEEVSRFLTRPWLWEQVEAASRVLLFQTDSIICSNANRTVDDFLEWDYIGAPVNPFLGVGYNGGLSLRNPKMILDILAGPSNDFDENWAANKTELCIEDNWYYRKMRELPDAKLPDLEVAKLFSVESVWYDRPVGFHAPRLWNEKRMDEVRAYCPEVELINKEKKQFYIDMHPELLSSGPA